MIKTNNIASLFQQKGVTFSSNLPDPSPTKRKRIYQEEDCEKESKVIGQSSDEGRTNLGQSSDEGRTNLGQSSDEGRTNLGQSSDIIMESSDKPKTQRRTSSRTNLGQSSDKGRTKESFSTLIGLQRKITVFIYQCCQFVRNKITEPLTIEHVALSCETTIQSAQKTIQRLEKKLIIIRVNFRTGRGGWTQYELNSDVFQEMLHLETQDKLRTNLGQSSDKAKTQPRTQSRTNLSSSSFLSVSASTQPFRSTTTNPDLENPEEASASNQLPADWEEIDYLGLESIKFGKTHLLQLYTRKYCDSKAAQESIWHFAFYLKTPASKTLKNPIAYLMSVMGRDKYFSRPDGYLTPEEETQQKRIDQQRKEIEGRQVRESQFFELVFEEYFLNLSAKKIRELSPTITNQEGTKIIIQNLFFREHWLEITEAFRQGLSVEQFLMPDTLTQTESEKSEPELSREEIRKIVDQQFGKVREDF